MTGYQSKKAEAQDKLAQPEQEPVACIYKGYLYMAHEFQSGQVPVDSQPLYTTPQRTEQNFCPRCGKRTQDIHTCTPPQEKNT